MASNILSIIRKSNYFMAERCSKTFVPNQKDQKWKLKKQILLNVRNIEIENIDF